MHEIKALIECVEEFYGKKLETTTDFDEFSLFLHRNNRGNLSSSTLKRLWGYVKDIHEPRKTTLNLLSQYVGYKSFDAFVRALKTDLKYNSSFFFHTAGS